MKIPTKSEVTEALELRHSKELQDKLQKAKVAICGLGGLGSHIAFSLARCGVGHLHLIDFDIVDLTNLNRQQYTINQIGKLKTEALKEQLEQIAPYINIKISSVKLTESNISTLLKEEDYICEAFDVPEQKAMLVNTILEQMPEKYLIAASGMAGYETGNTIVTKKITKHFYICGDGVTEIGENIGLMAPRVMLCAAHQANTVIQLISRKKNINE